MTLNVYDRIALGDVVHGYAAAVDERRFDDAVELFTDTAQLRLPDPPQHLEPVRTYEGHSGIRSAITAVAGVPRTEHAIVGELYWAQSADAARGRVACIAHHWSRRGEDIIDVVWHIRYDDVYVRMSAGGWRIQSRALTINAIETRPARRLR